jgi:iron complex outermembrane receptor protein
VGVQYVDRRFDNPASQAPNDPALGSDPTASPLPLWDLGDPSTWDRSAALPMASLTASRTDQTVKYQDHSAYAGATVGFLDDRLRLLAGWRLTTTDSWFTDHVAGVARPKATDSEVTPQYGLLCILKPGLSAYASYAESFVPGTFPITRPDGSSDIAKATHGWGVEAGLKADLFGGRLAGTFTLFDIRNKNIVNDLAVTDSSGAVHIYNVQSGEQRSSGAELDATVALNERWQLYLSYSCMNARITRFSADDAAILAQDWTALDPAGRANYKNVYRFHNAPLQMSAPRMANLWTRYDFNPGGRRGPYLAGGANWVQDQTLLPDTPRSAHQTYTLLSATVGYAWSFRGRQMSLDLMGKNLTDERYRPSQSTRSRPREFLLTYRTGV